MAGRLLLCLVPVGGRHRAQGPAPRHERTCWTDMSAMMGPEIAAEMGRPETNAFGTDEFLRYCLDLPAEPLLVANLGGGTPPGRAHPRRRPAGCATATSSAASPRPVRWWAIGNETWGGHELGHCSAEDYAARFVPLRRGDARRGPRPAPGRRRGVPRPVRPRGGRACGTAGTPPWSRRPASTSTSCRCTGTSPACSAGRCATTTATRSRWPPEPTTSSASSSRRSAEIDDAAPGR